MTASTPFDTNILCATPRSGSTLLCDLLESTKVAGRPASYFRRQSIPRWAERLNVTSRSAWQTPRFDLSYLEAVKKAAAAGTGVAGIRLMQESAGDLTQQLGRLFPGVTGDAARFERAFGRTRYVYLFREDKVAQAVSLLRAKQTGLWHRASDGSERERTGPPAEPRYIRVEISRLVDASAHCDEAWRTWFAAEDIEPLALSYETLSQDPAAALSELLAGLGLAWEQTAAAVPKTAKLGDALSQSWISRFRQEA